MRKEFNKYYASHSKLSRILDIDIFSLLLFLPLFIQLPFAPAGSQRWHRIQQNLSLKSSSNMHALLRSFFYKKTMHLDDYSLYTMPGVILCYPTNIVFGKNVFINRNVNITARAPISIGNDVLIGNNVIINSGNHNYSNSNLLIREQGHLTSPINIEDNVWIGANSVVLKGVTIGKGSVIGAGAVVTKDVPPKCVYGGVPARLIKVIEE